MTPKLTIGIKSRERLRRLADVFAVGLRLRIVTVLYKRPMSAKQFFEEYGGGTPSRVAQNFDRLAKTGWLRLVRTEGPGGTRRGAVERLYRSTELAFFDDEPWALMPYSMRVACSWSLFNQIATRLRQALEVTSQQASLKRDLSCVDLLLDHAGWEHVIEAVNSQFACIFEEQEDARFRASESGEELISVDVLLIAFESPGRLGQVDSSLVELDKEPLIPFPERLAPVLADDVCLQIIYELNHQATSMTQFHRQFGGASFSGVRSRFRRLEKAGWLKKVGERPRRGASEFFYRATRPAMENGARAWQGPPDSLRGTPSWSNFERFCEKALEAMRAGTFDARTNRSVTLSFLSLDRRGWTNVIAGIESLAEFLLEEEARAGVRMDKSGEEPIVVTVGLAAFETPGELPKEL